MARKPSKQSFETAKDRISFLETLINQRNADLQESQAINENLRRDLKGTEQHLHNRILQTTEMASRIGVLESDRDRLTTVVEVLARRLMSPAAEKDRSRAGWRAMNDNFQLQTLSVKDEAPRS